MSSWNSAAPYTGATLDNLHQSLGTPQFSGTAAENWYTVLNGLIIQGGTIEITNGTHSHDFITAFTQQVLGIFLQPHSGAGHADCVATSLSAFNVINAGGTRNAYWVAIGV